MKETWVVNGQDWETGFAVMLASEGRSEHTISAYLQDVGVFVRWWEQETGIGFVPEKLTNYDVHAFRRWQIDVRRVAASTWNRRRASLSRFCAWAVEMGWVAIDAMSGIQPMEREELPPRWLDRQEFSALMRQVEQNINGANTGLRRERAVRDAAMVALMAYAGLRVFEVVALEAGDIQISERSGRVVIRRGKGEKEAVVPLSREARRLVGAWVDMQSPPTSQESTGTRRPLTRGAYKGKDEQLFAMSTRSAELRVRAIGEQAGVEGLTPHRLRHTCCKRMLDAGVGVEKVQAVMRHANVQTTMRYGKPSLGDLADAVEAI